MSKKILIILPNNKDKFLNLILTMGKDIKNPFALIKDFINRERYLKEVNLEKLSGVLIYKACFDIIENLYSQDNNEYLYNEYEEIKGDIKDKLINWIQHTRSLELDFKFIQKASSSDLFVKFKEFLEEYNSKFNLETLDDIFDDIIDKLLKEYFFERINNYFNNNNVIYFDMLSSIETDILNSEYKSDLENIDKLIENIEIKEAEILLKRLKNKIIYNKKSSQENKYLYYFYKAKLEIKKNNSIEVSKAFKKASEFQENEIKKDILLALSYLNDDELSKAKKLNNKLLENYNELDDNDKINVLSIKIATIKTIKEVGNFINNDKFTSEIKKQANLNYGVGKVYAILGDFNNAISYLNEAKELGLKPRDLDLEINQMIIGKYQKEFNSNFHKPIKNNKELNNTINELKNKLESIKNEDKKYLSQFYVALGIGYNIIGESKKGLEILKKEYENNHSYLSCYNYAFDLNINAKYEELKEVTEKFFNENRIFENKNYNEYKGMTELYLVALLETQKYDELIKIANGYLENENFDSINQETINVFTTLNNAIVNSKNEDEFNKNISKYENKFKNTDFYLDFLFIKANGLRRFNKKEETKNILDFIYDKLKEDQFHKKLFNTNFNNTSFIEQLADEFHYLKDIERAKKLHESILNYEPNSNTGKLLDIYTQKTGELDKALDICQKVREKHGLIEKIAELEGIIYDQMGDLESTEKLYENYFKKYPSNKIKIHLGTIKDRLGKKLNDDFFDSINFEELNDKVSITNLSFLLLRNKKYELVLELVYKQKRKYPNNKYWKDFYLKLFMNIDVKYIENNHLDLNEVALNTVVTIVSENKDTYTYLLINEDESLLKDDEIDLNSELAQELIGKIKGNSFEYDGIEYKIDKINSKYLYEYNKTMSFINNPKYKSDFLLKKGNGLDSLEKELAGVSESRSKFLNRAIENYWANFMSINQLSQYLGEDNYKTISYLINAQKYGLFAFSGEEKANTKILNKAIVLDVISLISIHTLKIENYVSDIFDNIFVTLSSIDELESFKASYEGLFYDGNNKFLSKVIKWTRRNCKFKPIKKALEITQNKYNNHVSILGKSFFNSILLAEQENAILYSDDFRFNKTVLDIEAIKKETKNTKLKLFDFNIENIETTNSLELIETLYENKDINYDKLNEIKIKMLQNNYNFIIGNKDILIKSLELSKWEIENSKFNSSLILLNGNRYQGIYQNPLPYVLDLSIEFMLELLSKVDIKLKKKYNIIFKTLEYLDSTTSNLEIATTLIVKLRDLEKESIFRPELINVLSFWLSNKEIKKTDINKYNENFDKFLGNNLSINEDELINDVVSKSLNGFDTKMLLQSLKDKIKIDDNKELYKILIGFLENDGNISKFYNNRYYQKVLNTKTFQMASGLARNSILSKITNNQNMIKKLLDWINLQLKIIDDDQELEKYFKMLIDYLNSKNIIDFNKKYFNKQLISDNYKSLFKAEFIKASINILLSLTEKTAKNLHTKDMIVREKLKNEIQSYKNIINNENSIIDFEKDTVKMLDFLLFVLSSGDFRKYKDEIDKKTYNNFYTQYISTSDNGTIIGFIAEAKRIKNNDEFNDLPNYLEVIENFINNYQMATRKIFVIIKEYLENKDIKKYQNELLYADLVKLLLEDGGKFNDTRISKFSKRRV